MHSENFENQISNYAVATLSQNKFFAAAKMGQIQPDTVGKLLNNIHYLISHTPFFIEYAKNIAKQRGIEDIRGFLAHNEKEEQGHDKWAEADLANLKEATSIKSQFVVSPVVHDLVDFIKTTIERDPILLVPYVYFVENFTLRIGPELVETLVTKNKIPSSALSVISNHVQADAGHAEQDNMVLENLLTKYPNYKEKFAAVMEEASGYFNQMFEASIT